MRTDRPSDLHLPKETQFCKLIIYRGRVGNTTYSSGDTSRYFKVRVPLTYLSPTNTVCPRDSADRYQISVDFGQILSFPVNSPRQSQRYRNALREPVMPIGYGYWTRLVRCICSGGPATAKDKPPSADDHVRRCVTSPNFIDVCVEFEKGVASPQQDKGQH